MADEARWVDVRVKAHIFDWKPSDPPRSINLFDKESQALIRAGLVEVIDDDIRAEFPPPDNTAPTGGCGCG